jgi:hypothetical protein
MPGQSSRRLLAPPEWGRLHTSGLEIIEIHSYGTVGVERNVCRLLKRKAGDTAHGSELIGNLERDDKRLSSLAI